ncbi:PREDICTED: zinc finger CCCH-type with G patch domain-containing protein [Papilio polytes]|uniref:zinc finger CCCH-type with G patch domain-containing protein n=1 Tax=Papilio polytes TaxID=76194 RepID=UPI00067644F2|nr:PREDICTED: zinc finger CCCH-type with G patch domain-containing protein [Papilio polytes]
MRMEELENSLAQYNEQLQFVNDSLAEAQGDMRESLLALKSQMQNLIQVTQESLDAQKSKELKREENEENNVLDNSDRNKDELDEEYALFMQEMSKSGAYSTEENQDSTEVSKDDDNKSDIEDELATLLGMKCAVYHTHKWGGQPSLHNAMVSSVEPHQDNDQFSDLQVRVLFTHPTHAEMLPCPFYLDGECKFSDEQCRYSHGALVQLSSLKEAIEPNYESIKPGSRILLKLKPADGEDMSIAKKSIEKYHLWQIGVVKSVDFETKQCVVKLENGMKTGEKRKISADEFHLAFEEIFPLSNDSEADVESEDSVSDTEYPEHKLCRAEECMRVCQGIGSKLLLSMGYVPGGGLGAAGAGRLQPVQARVLPAGRALDHCLASAHAAHDPLKVEQKLKRLQKREEERNKRAYEREKERERRNVFNFLNRTLGDSSGKPETSTETSLTDIKQSTNKDLNIEQFKITQDTKKLELELNKLKNSLNKYSSGSSVSLNIKSQIAEKSRELDNLKNREQNIEKEQRRRKDKKNMTVF